MGLISEITGVPKDGPDPLQYIHDKDNDRKLAMTLKKSYVLECDRRAYHIDRINDCVVRIGAKILASEVVRKNCATM